MSWFTIRTATLSQRLSAVFVLLLLACCGGFAWLQMRSNTLHEQEAIQRLSLGLASHIAANTELMQGQNPNVAAVNVLFGKLMDVNPSVEVYLLAPDGHIEAQAAPEGHLKRNSVDVAPIKRLLAGDMLPVFGDDPRSVGGRKVFSAAPLVSNGQDAGFVYVVLIGEDYDAVTRHLSASAAFRTALWTIALMAALSLVAGLLAFHFITRPLRRLTDDVQRFQADGVAMVEYPPAPADTSSRDEIMVLRGAFASMTERIALQWRELSAQDQQRREMVANISHDLRTPLTSLHGYLETLRIKADTLTESERERYLDVALGQSRKVGRLAQELFELARLECGVVKPERENFSLPELVQDVFQKFELAAEARHKQLDAEIAPELPSITADLGMIERVLTNLLDNAIRHTPAGGSVKVQLKRDGSHVAVEVSDDGPGIPDSLRSTLFTRAALRSNTASIGNRSSTEMSGGLGLLIVQRILQLHGSEIKLAQAPGTGAAFRFRLDAA